MKNWYTLDRDDSSKTKKLYNQTPLDDDTTADENRKNEKLLTKPLKGRIASQTDSTFKPTGGTNFDGA